MTDTDDQGQPSRPNAKYKLSKTDERPNPYGDDNLVFHYNREHRLEKAPQSVRDLYSGNPKNRGGFFKTLTGDKSRSAVFFSIVIMCFFLWILVFLGKFDDSYTLDGNNIKISGIRYEDSTIVVLKKTLKKSKSAAYSGSVDIAVSPEVSSADEITESNVFYHRIFFSMAEEEEYRFVVPFDSPVLLMILQTEKSSKNISFKPE
jgi:hypothetical protein